MMASGEEVSSKAMESGEVSLGTVISGSGTSLKLKATVCISGKMGTDMKENGKIVSNMGKEPIFLQIKTNIQEAMSVASQTDMEPTSGPTDLPT
jgi:hypothetical protein